MHRLQCCCASQLKAKPPSWPLDASFAHLLRSDEQRRSVIQTLCNMARLFNSGAINRDQAYPVVLWRTGLVRAAMVHHASRQRPGAFWFSCSHCHRGRKYWVGHRASRLPGEVATHGLPALRNVGQACTGL